METIIITGGSDGIGAAAARQLHGRGHKVVIAGRSADKTKRLADELGIDYYVADFAKLSDVRKLARQLLQNYPHIDVLVNNAGFIAGKTRTLTDDGMESTFQVNHLAPFLLTQLLLDRLIASHARVIVTSSMANSRGIVDIDNLNSERDYAPFKTYANSKLMNIMFARELSQKYHTSGLEAVSFHPGVIASGFGTTSDGLTGKLYRSVIGKFMGSPDKGADTLVWLATTDDVESGKYYDKRQVTQHNRQVDDVNLRHRLWKKSEEAVATN